MGSSPGVSALVVALEKVAAAASDAGAAKAARRFAELLGTDESIDEALLRRVRYALSDFKSDFTDVIGNDAYWRAVDEATAIAKQVLREVTERRSAAEKS